MSRPKGLPVFKSVLGFVEAYLDHASTSNEATRGIQGGIADCLNPLPYPKFSKLHMEVACDHESCHHDAPSARPV